MSIITIRLTSIAVALGMVFASSARADEDDGQPVPQPGYPQGYPQGYPPPQPYAPPYAPPVYQEPTPQGPEEITSYQDGQPIPWGYTRVQKARKGLVIGGAVTLGVVYGFSAVFGAIGNDLRDAGETRTDTSAMWIPIAGPFLQLKETSTSTGKLFFFHVGLAQTAGALMLIYGLTSPRTLLVRNDQLSVVPMLSKDAGGMMVSG
ncbi:MAG: hypothetical protein ABI175_27050, partial [Polyangiales bacterium]